MSVTIVNSLPQELWRGFVNTHPAGNIFHTPEMYEVFRLTEDFVPELWAAVSEDQVLALFMPVRVSLGNAWPPALTTRSVVYGGVLSQTDPAGREALRLLLQVYKKTSGKHTLFTELRNILSPGDLLPILSEEGFVYEDHLNYLIDLDLPVDAIFERIGKRTRRNIKRGLNRGSVSIEEVVDRADLAACYRLLAVTYRSAHVPLADSSLFEAAFDILRPKNMVRFSLAKVEGITAATSVELLFKDVMYGWYGGTDRAYASHVPNDLLTWDLLRWGAGHGYRRYDFGGAGKPNEEYGVRDFKAKFGGGLVSYGRNTWTPRPLLLRICEAGYALLRWFV